MKAGKAHFGLRLFSVLWLLMGIAPLFAQSQRTEKVKPPFPSIRLSRHFHDEEAVHVLGGNLPAVASWYGKTASEMAKLLRHDRNLWVSPTGRLMYTCEMETPLAADAAAANGITRDHIATFPLDQTFKLHSLPGSKRSIYLDFDGGTVTDTAWNANHNGGADIIAAPFDLDGSPGTFNATELQRIQNIWKRVAEDYSPFDVDVTTEQPSDDALARSSSSDDTFGNRVMITPTNFYPDAGGVSYVGAFNDVGEYYKISWAFSNMLQNGEKYIAEACSHENGHSVGLHHEGTTSGTVYYQGQGDWAPIMGNSYYNNVTQWAQGEYAGANNTEDQLQVMQNYGLAYFTDDHGNTEDTATQLAVGSTIRESGFIERNIDVDVFKLLAGAGMVSISVTPAPLGPDLKVLAEVRDADWNLLASSSNSDLSASINATVPAGTYYLTVSGVGSGDPTSTGYSNYASLGQYAVTGTVVDPGTPPSPPNEPTNFNSALRIPSATVNPPQMRLIWRDNASNETGFVIERCTGNGCSSFAPFATVGPKTIGPPQVTCDDPTVSAGNTYSYRMKAVNTGGSSAWATLADRSVPQIPPTPGNFTAAALKLVTGGYHISLAWTATGPNPTNFTIQRANNTSFTTNLVTATVSGSARTSQQTVLKNTVYYYRIRSNNTGGSTIWVSASPYPISTGN